MRHSLYKVFSFRTFTLGVAFISVLASQNQAFAAKGDVRFACKSAKLVESLFPRFEAGLRGLKIVSADRLDNSYDIRFYARSARIPVMSKDIGYQPATVFSPNYEVYKFEMPSVTRDEYSFSLTITYGNKNSKRATGLLQVRQWSSVVFRPYMEFICAYGSGAL